MSKAEPTIQKFMTYQPHSIQSHKTIDDAEMMMSKLKIRHLPVTEDEELIGILSDRDIKLAASIIGENPKLALIKDVCHENPFIVSPDSKLHEVVDEMAAKRYGSALVVQNDKLVGIFTTVDVCRALSQVLQTRFHEH